MDLLTNWDKYQEHLRTDKIDSIENLKNGILSHYEDRKIKEEKLEQYKTKLVEILKTTNEIK